MTYGNKKEELIEACMQVVAENSLSGFSMKKVTSRVGVSEALVYKHFESKEKLLYVCFESVHKQIAALFQGMEKRLPQTEEELYESIRMMWLTYFKFLVRNGCHTIFYFEYRDSPYIRDIVKNDSEARSTYFKEFVDIYLLYDRQFHLSSKISGDYLWTYILDTSGIFAKRIILGMLPDTEESYESIWKLLSGGLIGLLQE